MREETNIAGNIGKIFKISTNTTCCFCYCMLTQVDSYEYKLITIVGFLVGNRFNDLVFKGDDNYTETINVLTDDLYAAGFYLETTNKKITLK